MTPPESTQIALELERLRGSVDTGFATLNGRLDTALQRATQTEKDLDELEQRVLALERARWPLPSVAALVSVAALGIAVYEAVGR
ncbi:hypothetical protein ABZY90_19490 [Streptomyces sp. NPDC006422]|uniref:hypothetical protein n=1 Tax=unclassified Streptomyces TaxID=2593676 RepID=UPI0033BE4497